MWWSGKGEEERWERAVSMERDWDRGDKEELERERDEEEEEEDGR